MVKKQGRLSRWSTDKIAGDLARAAAAGHDVNSLVTLPSAPGQQQGTYAVCTCGWRSTPRRPVAAAAAALWHALDVGAALDERKRLDGVEWSDAPSSAKLRQLLAKSDGVSLVGSHEVSD